MRRLLAAAALVAALAAALGALQRRFDDADVRRGIARALAYRPAGAGPSVLEALEALGEGAPRCGGDVVSQPLGDVRVACANPRGAAVEYVFRVLVGGERPPRGESAAASALLARLAGAPRDGPGPAASR